MIPYLFPDLRNRSYDLELMDLSSSDPIRLIQTIKQFKLINILFTASRRLLYKYIVKDMLLDKTRHYHFAELGAGGGDIAIWLAKICLKKKLDISITCFENDDRIVDFIEKQCQRYPNITINNTSAFDIYKFPERIDYLFSNHFLHHLPENEITELIKNISLKTERRFILNDIRRSNLAYLGYTLFTGLFMHNSFAFYDGRLSIKKGFSRDDMRSLISSSSSNTSIEIIETAPARIVIFGEKKQSF